MNDEKELITESRLKLLECVPDIFEFKKCLYVGASHLRCWFAEDFKNVDLLEAYKPNCEFYKDKKIFGKIYNDSILTFNQYEGYDLIFWYCGPEHVKKEDFFLWVPKIKDQTIVINVPWGVYYEGAEYGNPYEIHLSSLYLNDFECMGFNVKGYGIPDKRNEGEIFAWKRK